MVPSVELKNIEGSGVDGKMIVESALPGAYSSGNVHQKEENRAPYDSRSLLMSVLTLDMAKTYFSSP